ncbi:hypothetical protein XELAEV_18006158mg [Xenopus laevis]|uniref:Uncharacterized protein n=1 Tax=Xenopus laevis TaxID=8355 RepID=A0A974I3Y7_XENLA|nr:hypothetical protein XELAEV_18006158mg [Xenopus laevis]
MFTCVSSITLKTYWQIKYILMKVILLFCVNGAETDVNNGLGKALLIMNTIYELENFPTALNLTCCSPTHTQSTPKVLLHFSKLPLMTL